MTLSMRTAWRRGEPAEALLTREWLVTNGLGGYGAGTLAGVCTRRFHGLLIAAFPSPLGRIVYANHLAESATFADGTVHRMSGDHEANVAPQLPDVQWLSEVRFEDGLPVWRFEQAGIVLEKRLVVVHRQNSCIVSYRLLESPKPVLLTLRPSFQIRPHEGTLVRPAIDPYPLTVSGDRCEMGAPGYPTLRLHVVARESRLVLDTVAVRDRFYSVEAARGYDDTGPLFTPGAYQVSLVAGERASLRVSTEEWERMTALTPDEVASAEAERRQRLIFQAHPKVQADRTGFLQELVFAADQFVINPARSADTARAQASGDDVRTVIAGYHWFTDWGRDTMISLEGLTLLTGRRAEAGYILRTFAHYVRDGLIPNMFPEGEAQGLYHTADATMWFFHAIERYLRETKDTETLGYLLPTLIDIIDHHERGTSFGIGVDPKDGLLRQGAEGYQLTWMDAKVGDWVVTPRRGKAVEINALFFNALRLLEGWVRDVYGDARAERYRALADRVSLSFNERFWYAEGNHLYDVVDGEQGDDPAVRPNQVFAISLAHPVLDRARWGAVLSIVRDQLWTPVGLRSLSPRHPDYKARYDGDLRARDAAYHQGTVWGWLIGPFVDAWRRAYPDDHEGVQGFLRGFASHLGEAGIGTISEIFDAESPYLPRGCVAQAWSVAEVLRATLGLSDSDDRGTAARESTNR